jgi:hypothetical protein
MQSRKIRPKGGNDPAFGCRAPRAALVVPALWLQRLEHSRIETRSVRYPELIGIRHVQGR